MASRRISILPWRAWLLRSYGCARACTHTHADKAMSALLPHRRRAKAYPIWVTTGKVQAEQYASALASIVDMKESWRHFAVGQCWRASGHFGDRHVAFCTAQQQIESPFALAGPKAAHSAGDEQANGGRCRCVARSTRDLPVASGIP